MKFQNSLAKYYDSRVKEYGDSFKSVGWSSYKSQQIRFKQFLPFLPNDNFTLNDIGCGLGDFLNILFENKIFNFSYFGYDISEEMLEIAKKNFKNSKNIKFLKEGKIENIELSDYSIASGTFGKKIFFVPRRKIVNSFYETLIKISKKSKKGFGFNFLSKNRKSRFYDGLFYLDKKEVISFVKENFGNNYTILDTYDEVDVTIWINKSQKKIY